VLRSNCHPAAAQIWQPASTLVRFTNSAGTVKQAVDYYPYGAEWRRDLVAGQDLFPAVRGTIDPRIAPLSAYTMGITEALPFSAWYPCDMDTLTSHDLPRQVATGNDTDYTLSLDEVAEHYARAGHARTLRTLQRYCVSGHLDAQKVATALGDKYLVTPQSVARHIAQIEEQVALDMTAAGRGLSRQVATPVVPEQRPPIQEVPPPTGPVVQRQVATEEGESSRYVAQLEKRIEEKDVVIGLLRGELVQRNEEIVRRNERERETNILIRGLQNLVLRLQPGRAPAADVLDNDPLMQGRDGDGMPGGPVAGM
jgi:hypothetical protein